MKTMQRHSFSLVEILVVVSIILVLTGMVLGIAPYVNKRTRNAKTTAQITQLQIVFQSYKEDWGYFPQQKNPGPISASFWLSLKRSDTGKPYYREEEFNFLPDGTPVDGFSNTFFYTSPGLRNTSTYDLWSMGPDGVHGDAAAAKTVTTAVNADDDCDDVTNWKKASGN